MELLSLTGSFQDWLRARREKLGMTREELAERVVFSVDTIKSLERGTRRPSKELAECLAKVLGVSDSQLKEFIEFARQPTDLKTDVVDTPPLAKDSQDELRGTKFLPLLRSIGWPWTVTGGVLLIVLAAIVVAYMRYQAAQVTASISITPNTPAPILEQLPVLVEETFDNNHHAWGVGSKNDGSGIIERSMIHGSYVLTLTTTTYTVFLGGDSSIFSPPVYYATVDATRMSGGENDGCVFFFDELSDAQHSVFRVRDAMQLISVSSVDSSNKWTTPVNRTNAPSVRPGATNKLGILANGDQFSFFVNDTLVAQTTKQRLPGSRIDVGIVGTVQGQPVVCRFDNFIVRVPK